MLGIVQAAFDGGMFAWVSVWVPALMVVKPEGAHLPCGRIFSCFMLCISGGANLFAAGQSRHSLCSLMSVALALSVGAMMLPLLVPYPPSFASVMGAFCAFEVAVGALQPSMGIMRASVIPEGVQSTMMTAYRLPLNIIVVLGTQLGSKYGWMAVCALNSALFILAMMLVAAIGATPPPPATSAKQPPDQRQLPQPKHRSVSPKRRASKSPARRTAKSKRE